MIHTHLPRNCVVFLLITLRTNTVGHGSQNSNKWLTVYVFVDEVKGKPRKFE